jgi:hypothetical protein
MSLSVSTAPVAAAAAPTAAVAQVTVNVGGLWRTRVNVDATTTWRDFKTSIRRATGVPDGYQQLTPRAAADIDTLCQLVDGDEVLCEWDLEGSHPLHYAGMANNVEAVRSWVVSGADVNVTDTCGLTPMMWASMHACSHSIAEMLRLGADVRRVDSIGCTSLHLVATANRKDAAAAAAVVRMLVAAGCDPAVRDHDNRTVVEFARVIDGDVWATTVDGWIAGAGAAE